MKIPKHSNSWKRCPNVPKGMKKLTKLDKHFTDVFSTVRLLQAGYLSSTSESSNEDLDIKNSNMLEGQFEIVEDPDPGTNQYDSHSDKDLSYTLDNNGGNEDE